ncbi:hypothetical protein AB4525_15715 [Vibrio breoganii]
MKSHTIKQDDLTQNHILENQLNYCMTFLSHAQTINTPSISSYSIKHTIQTLLESITPPEHRLSCYISDRAVELAAEYMNIPCRNGDVALSTPWYDHIERQRCDIVTLSELRSREFNSLDEAILFCQTRL